MEGSDEPLGHDEKGAAWGEEGVKEVCKTFQEIDEFIRVGRYLCFDR